MVRRSMSVARSARLVLTPRALSLVVVTVLVSCGRQHVGDGLRSGYDESRPRDAGAFDVGSFNYTDRDIYDVLLSPVDAKNFDGAILVSGAAATPGDATQWSIPHAAMAALRWDARWQVPHPLKATWLTLVDRQAFASDLGYDKYREQRAQRGTAWCQAQVLVPRAPTPGSMSFLDLHFMPDGSVKATVTDLSQEPIVPRRSPDESKIALTAPCAQAASNPFFGLPKPPTHIE